jgi:hypothetical protein
MLSAGKERGLASGFQNSSAAEAVIMIQTTRPMNAIRNGTFALTLTLAAATTVAAPSYGQDQPFPHVTTGMMVMVTVKAGVTRDQVMAVMPAEIRETVQLYLDGKIREWYSRSDGRGVILLLDTKDVAEARAIMDGLPLGKQNLADDQFIPVGPLAPLRMLTTRP